MTYTPPPQPDYPAPVPPGAAPKPKGRAWWRAGWALGIAGLILGLIIGIASASGGSSTKTVAGPTVSVTIPVVHTVTATTTPTVVQTIATHTAVVTQTYTPPPPKQIGEGIYVVGTDIQPGTYHTDGGGGLCYWARLSSLNTSDILDNNAGSGPQTVQIQPPDKAFQVRGSCTFGRIG